MSSWIHGVDGDIPQTGGASNSLLCPETEVAWKFIAVMVALDLAQLIDSPTHTGCNTLDLVFVVGQWQDA